MSGVSGSARIRVRYAETDQMGVVYHGNYFTWFEVGRVELLRQVGLELQDARGGRRQPARDRGHLPVPAPGAVR